MLWNCLNIVFYGKFSAYHLALARFSLRFHIIERVLFLCRSQVGSVTTLQLGHFYITPT